MYDKYAAHSIQQLVEATTVHLGDEPPALEVEALLATERAAKIALRDRMEDRNRSTLALLKTVIPTEDQASELLIMMHYKFEKWPGRYPPQPIADDVFHELLRNARHPMQSLNSTSSSTSAQGSTTDSGGYEPLDDLCRAVSEDQTSSLDETHNSRNVEKDSDVLKEIQTSRHSHYSPLAESVNLDNLAMTPPPKTNEKPAPKPQRTQAQKRRHTTTANALNDQAPTNKKQCTPDHLRAKPRLVKGKGDKLSNFSFSEFSYRGIRYTSAEQAYQCAKACHHRLPELARRIQNTHDGARCKAMTRVIKPATIYPSWEQSKVNIMYDIMRSKFTSKCTNARKCLLETGSAPLYHNVDDVFWGTGRTDETWEAHPRGRDVFSKLLMRIRSDLNRSHTPSTQDINNFLASLAPQPRYIPKWELMHTVPGYRRIHKVADTGDDAAPTPVPHEEPAQEWIVVDEVSDDLPMDLTSPSRQNVSANTAASSTGGPIPTGNMTTPPLRQPLLPRPPTREDKYMIPRRHAPAATHNPTNTDRYNTSNAPRSLLDMSPQKPYAGRQLSFHSDNTGFKQQNTSNFRTIARQAKSTIGDPMPLDPNHTTVILGDSQLARMTLPAAATHVVTVSMSGAQFKHIAERLKHAPPAPHVTKIILAVGINNRSQDYLKSSRKKFVDMVNKCTQAAFPNATPYVAEIAYSRRLPYREVANLEQTNAGMYRDCPGLKKNNRGETPRLLPLPQRPLEFESSARKWQHLHLTNSSADLLVRHWLRIIED